MIGSYKSAYNNLFLTVGKDKPTKDTLEAPINDNSISAIFYVLILALS